MKRVLQCLQRGHFETITAKLIACKNILEMFLESKCGFLDFFFVSLKCRLGKDVSSNTNSGIYRCAVCLADQDQSSGNNGLSMNADHFIMPVSVSKPREGPFLCTICQKKKDAMEGKRS